MRMCQAMMQNGFSLIPILCNSTNTVECPVSSDIQGNLLTVTSCNIKTQIISTQYTMAQNAQSPSKELRQDGRRQVQNHAGQAPTPTALSQTPAVSLSKGSYGFSLCNFLYTSPWLLIHAAFRAWCLKAWVTYITASKYN